MTDLIVIGAGVGGYPAAIRAAQLGLKTVLVEKSDVLGGTCLNVGCIPSKALLESSELYHVVTSKVREHGIHVESAQLDLPAFLARKAEIVRTLTDGVAGLLKKNKVQRLQGTATLVGPRTVRVTGPDGATQDLEAKNVLLATGSVPVELPFLPFDGRTIVSSTEALAFDKVPEHLVVVGAGAVGLELGSVWRRLGAKVTVVEILPRIVPFADRQIAQTLQRALTAQGFEFRLKTKVTGATVEGPVVRVRLEDAKGELEELVADRVLVAVGRRPYTSGLGLEGVGIALDERGRIPVDEHFRTVIEGVYAVGDVTPGPMLAHKAEEEGIAAAEIIAGKPGHVNRDLIPNVVYTAPELASVGKTEDELKEAGVKANVGRFLFRANGRAMSIGETEGMVKILADKQTDRLLGVHIVGPRASDLIAECVVAMEFKASAEDLARTIHAHPTLSEVVKEAAMDVGGWAIHA